MGSQSIVTKSQFIAAPIDGLNLVDPPHLLKPTEARQLDNYYIYDWGIRERGPFTTVALPDGGYPESMFTVSSTSKGQLVWISSSNSNIYYYNGTSFSSSFSTGGSSGNKASSMFFFNRKVVFVDSPPAHTYDITTDTYTTSGVNYNGPALAQKGFGFKDRIYIINNDTLSSTVQFGDVDQIAGTLPNEIDFSSIFQTGQTPSWGIAWPFNQGLSNDELFVLGNNNGEILIYSGDSPLSATFQLANKVQIPALLGVSVYSNTLTLPTILKLGQDILINTTRGLISLSQVVNGRIQDAVYYAISRKIGPVLAGATGDVSYNYPFAYFSGGTGRDIYVLNYERGAWSKFPNVAPVGQTITCIAVTKPPYAPIGANPGTSYVYFGLSGGGFMQLTEGALSGADTTATYTYSSPYFNWGTPSQKSSKMVRVIGRDMNSTAFTNTVAISRDFQDGTLGASSSATTSSGVANQAYTMQEVAPPGIGTDLSFKFSKTGSASSVNEISGYKVFYEDGGGLY